MIHFTFHQLFTVLGPILGWVAGKVTDHILKIRRMKLFSKKHDPVIESMKNTMLIENKLSDILQEFEADRVYILQFHNGGNFYPSGKSIMKFSVFYEKGSPGTTTVRDKYQNIPVSIFGRFFNYLSENNISYYTDIKKTTMEDFEVRGFTKDTDAKSTYCSSIVSIDNKFMGVLVIHYTSKRKVLAEDTIKNIQVHASSLASVLTTHIDNKPK